MFHVFQLLLCAIVIRTSFAEKCACATGNVHVRDGAGASHKILGILTPGECVTYKGNKVNVGTMPWAHVHYKGQSGYATTQWVKIEECPGWDDIGYTFIIGEDGNVYEGRGWGIIGTHTLNHNSDGLGFCVIGNFVDHVPNAAAIRALKQLISCGAHHGKIRSNYKILGHRDVRATACPGQKLYNLIKQWPHFYTHH